MSAGRPGPLCFRSLFVSDVHLGSPRCHAERLRALLEATSVQFLYLVGDLVDRWDPSGTSRWPAGHYQVLRAVRAQAEAEACVLYLPGNHDGQFGRDWHATHPCFLSSAELEHRGLDGRRYLVSHGHRFERQLPSLAARALDAVARRVDGAARRLDRTAPVLRAARGFARLRELVKSGSGYAASFERRAAQLARSQGYDGVICGHVHRPADRVIEGVRYLNDGDWISSCSALVEHLDGHIELLGWDALQRLGVGRPERTRRPAA
jgi:UDP-2,3-diacylglucosamine pyrophosphatase LpxH